MVDTCGSKNNNNNGIFEFPLTFLFPIFEKPLLFSFDIQPEEGPSIRAETSSPICKFLSGWS